MPNLATDLTLAHVIGLPLVKDFLARIDKSKVAPLFEEYRESFPICSAAATRHHNFTHGLLIHTAEVWQCAQKFLAVAPESVAYTKARQESKPGSFSFTEEELFVACAIHDLAKVKQYEPGDNHTWRKVPMTMNQECWTLWELARFGITLTENEVIGLLHAEGGYTEFAVDWRPMSVIVHAADLWSSQAMAPIWNPAEALDLRCPRCGKGMLPKQGPSGAFFGCSAYPACRGTRDAGSVPPIGEKFLAWLKAMYPLPSLS